MAKIEMDLEVGQVVVLKGRWVDLTICRVKSMTGFVSATGSACRAVDVVGLYNNKTTYSREPSGLMTRDEAVVELGRQYQKALIELVQSEDE